MLLTRLPLPLRSVRLACVRPAASVRSEPGSNSQIESLDSGFGLEVSPRILLRNGHLHTLARTDCSAHAMVMAETQISPESRSITTVTSRNLARTPPPAFPFLQISIVKERPNDDNASQSFRMAFETTKFPPGGPVENHKGHRENVARQGRRSTHVPRTSHE